MGSIDDILKERGDRYGDFEDHAILSQHLKYVMKKGSKWSEMEPFQRESLEMIAHKIARILNGDPDYVDSWDDIAGYAKLVSDQLKS